jgi:AcrR family transcriptional regulator
MAMTARSSGLRERKTAETRAKILSVAEALFRREGCARTTTAGLAERVGIAEGTIFNYVSSKAELLVSLFDRAFLRERYTFEPNPTGDLQPVLPHGRSRGSHPAASGAVPAS